MDESIEIPSFKNTGEECAFWKSKYIDVKQKLAEVKHEYTDFEENSRELEAELEATLEQRDKTIRDLKSSLNQIQNDNESLRVSLSDFASIHDPHSHSINEKFQCRIRNSCVNRFRCFFV